MSSSQIAENYQLKWHSHLTNLNSSVATLFRNDKFADVLLFTSQSEGGSGIPAHKIILSSCSHFFAQIFESNPAPPNSMVYIVLPPELSKRSIQILIQYMYSGEATVSNDILNEVLHGGELLKIRGLCRNKHTNSMISVNDTTAAAASAATTATSHYIPNESTCEKSLYDQHMERLSNNTSNSNLSIIKESPVIMTSPPHIGSATIGHKSSSTSTTPGPCAVEPDIPKRSSLSYGLKPTIIRNHCAYSSNNVPLHMKSSGPGTSHYELSHMPPPVQQITSSTSASLMHSPDSHSCGATNNPNNQNHPNGNCNMGVKKESMTINTIETMNDDSINVPSSHYSSIPIQMTSTTLAVKKAQQISEKRCANSTSIHYHKAHITNHDPQTVNEMRTKHIENGNNTTATITTTSTTNDSFVRRYSDDYFAKDDLLSGNHLHHQQHAQQPMHEYNRKTDKDQQQTQPQNSTSRNSYDKIESPIQSIQMTDEMQLIAIKQEPIEWADFEHDNGSIEKSNIDVSVKPELIYSKEDADDDAEWVRHIESHAESTHCVPKKRKRIESSCLTDNIAALRCDLCEMYFATPAEWVRHVQNHTETELALSNSNASLRQTNVNNTTNNASSHRSSRPQQQQQHHIESTKYSHTQANSHR